MINTTLTMATITRVSLQQQKDACPHWRHFSLTEFLQNLFLILHMSLLTHAANVSEMTVPLRLTSLSVVEDL